VASNRDSALQGDPGNVLGFGDLREKEVGGRLVAGAAPHGPPVSAPHKWGALTASHPATCSAGMISGSCPRPKGLSLRSSPIRQSCRIVAPSIRPLLLPKTKKSAKPKGLSDFFSWWARRVDCRTSFRTNRVSYLSTIM
jgi:hypothetical protein